jgi:hypothetical protein
MKLQPPISYKWDSISKHSHSTWSSSVQPINLFLINYLIWWNQVRMVVYHSKYPSLVWSKGQVEILVLGSHPHHLPMGTEWVTNGLPRWNHILTQLRFIHSSVIMGIQWMDGVLVGAGLLWAVMNMVFFRT